MFLAAGWASVTFIDVYRDRENCTVFVADLPVGVTEAELSDLFKDVSIFVVC
jgi:RNA recognition motif-containing protein